MRNTSYLYIYICILTLGLASCSETKNLAEGEVLYDGIKRIAFDKPVQHKPLADSTGVITAIGDAYNTVSQYLNPSAASAQGERGNYSTQDNPSAQAENERELLPEAKDEVEGVLAYAPNNSLMGSSYYRQPLAFGLWVYNRYVNSQRRFGRWMFNTFAATPITLTSVNPRVRTKVAQQTLRNYGYFRGSAAYDTIATRNPRKAKVAYEIHHGPLFHLDSIAYLGFPREADSIIHATQRLTLLHRGDPFSVPNLDGERQRLTKAMRNEGYYFIRPEHIAYRADTVARPLHVQLQVSPRPDAPDEVARQYRMGQTHIYVYRHGDDEIVDTLKRPTKLNWRQRRARERRMKKSGGTASEARARRQPSVTMAYSGTPGTPPLKMRALRRFISYRPGDLYRLHVQEAMQENISRMGIFSQVGVRYVPKTEDTLDVDITLRLDRPYDAEFKGNVATKSNGLVGPGVSFSMSKQNLFRGAETLGFEAYGSYEWMTGAQMKGKHSLMNSFEWGTALNLTYPRLLLLGLGDRFNRRAQATTAYKVSADWMNRSGYFSRVSFGARVMYTYQRRSRYQHEVVPLRLDYEKQLHTTARFDSIALSNPALYTSLRDQFVPSAQYTFTHTNPASRDRKRRVTLSLKEAGNLTSLIYRMGGHGFKERDKGLFGVPFAQYVRLTAEYTQQLRLGHTRTFLAGRIFGGIIRSFGNATTAPYADLFTVGGANSIRAFGVRSIGPGSYHPANSGYSYITQTGDLKLEANLEWRFPMISNLGGAIFLDAGNVWLQKKDATRPGGAIGEGNFAREIALGTGFGLRYDLSFLVIRFDVGIGLHAPYDTGRRGYYNMGRFWDSLGFHLAVGYPF